MIKGDDLSELSPFFTEREALLLSHFTCHSFRHAFCARFCEHETKMKQSMEALSERLDSFRLNEKLNSSSN